MHPNGMGWSCARHPSTVLKLESVFLTLPSLCVSYNYVHILVIIDNTTAIAHVNKMVSTKVRLVQLTSSIYRWANSRYITDQVASSALT